MKKVTLLICAAIFTSGIAFSQQKKSSKKAKTAKKIEAPASVKDAFTQNADFAAATDAQWAKTSGGNWIASFNRENVKTAVEYNAEGTWVATRSTFETGNLPETVLGTLKNKYPSAVVKEGWKIERADVAPYYKVNIDDNGTAKTVLLNDAGTIVD
ncbi:PepSY-like domain-containing protein [Chitinophaga sp. GCM10012297]|uniref:PepSY-like domain-containing protein n=1 Tax=Chitinophaga chungangae TaxID=2821488 RepID=A0ABS3YD60_9BACT|nr:PepSY-like domain-containing protein [Chitinophaga chungangae]MBO9152596.1 PepSY-like domain-containing protein [Chitinophaga chungangae]